MDNMFCFQCEQAAQGTGCTKIGVCGKQPEVAALQDLLVYALKGIAFWADKARAAGKKDAEIDRFMIEGLFTTVTNVDFDAEAIAKILQKAGTILEKAQALAGPVAGGVPAAANWQPAASTAALIAAGAAHGVKSDAIDPDVKSVQEMLVYGLKGDAAYADHALILGRENDEVYAFIHKALAATLDPDPRAEDFVGLAMECGEMNLVPWSCSTRPTPAAYGHPVPTPVRSAPRPARRSWSPATT